MTDPRDPARGGFDHGHGDERDDRPGTPSRYAPQAYLPQAPAEDSDPTPHRGRGPERSDTDGDRYVGHQGDRYAHDSDPEAGPHVEHGDPEAGDPEPTEHEHSQHEDLEPDSDEYLAYEDDPAHDLDAPHELQPLFAEEHDEHDDQGLEGAVAASTWSSRRQRTAHRRTARRRRLRGAVVLVLALAVVAGAGAVAFGKLKPLLTFSSDSGDDPGPGTGSVSSSSR